MKKLYKSAVIAACLPVFITSNTDAGIFNSIDFGSQFRSPDTGIVILDDQFDAVFAQHGVHFSSPTNNPIFWLGSDYGFQAAASSIVMGDPRTGENSTHPLRIDFLIPVLSVSIQGIDGGNDVDTLTMRAYSSDNILLAQHSITHTFGAQQTVGVLATNIDYVLIEQSGVNHGVFLDNLTYIQQVPAPSTLALLMLGLATKRKR